MQPYDDSNIFARILRGEIPVHQKVYEDDHVLAFHDILPKAPLHVLVIPKGKYATIYDFYKQASAEELLHFSRAVTRIIDQLDIQKKGYRIVTNCGRMGGQEVPHFHLHILSGRPLGSMVEPLETAPSF
ncbi:MAG: histidine triad nucleotide-binding protein [Caedimonas sp.]|nr:histidine triad nucleotide-binding protein [Caedimonas sp.]